VDGVPRTLSNNISLVQIDLFTQKGKFYFFKNVSSELLVLFQKYFVDFFWIFEVLTYAHSCFKNFHLYMYLYSLPPPHQMFEG